jgi:predicted dehydrogenase
MSPIRVGLATLEHDHAWWTLDHIDAAPGARLVGVVDRDPARRERLRHLRPDCTVFDDVGQLLDAGCDALVVTAPNNEHRALVEAAAGAGIACMVQKPMATTYRDALDMAEAAASRALMINYFPLWQPAKVALFDLVRAGDLGDLRQLTFRNGHQGPRGIGVLTEDYQRWLYDPIRHGGGALADQATYGIAYAVWLLGMPQRVYATETPVARHELGADDIATVLLDYPATQVRVDGSWGWPHRIESIECIGSSGSVVLQDGAVVRRPATKRLSDPIETESIPADVAPAAPNGIAHFVEVVRSGVPILRPHTVADNLLIAQVTDAALRSAAMNAPVSMP